MLCGFFVWVLCLVTFVTFVFWGLSWVLFASKVGLLFCVVNALRFCVLVFVILVNSHYVLYCFVCVLNFRFCFAGIGLLDLLFVICSIVVCLV